MNSSNPRKRRIWPRRLAFGSAGVLVLGAIVFGIAWLRQGSDPAVEELRVAIAAREAARAKAPQATPQTHEGVHAPSDPSPAHGEWDALVAQGKATQFEDAWWETWNALAAIPRHERSEEDWQALAMMLEEHAAWMGAVRQRIEDGLPLYAPEDLDPLNEGLDGRERVVLALGRLLREEAALHVEAGNPEAAMETLLTIWDAGELLRDTPWTVTQLFRQDTQVNALQLIPGPEEFGEAPMRALARRLVEKLGAANYLEAQAQALVGEAHSALEHFREEREQGNIVLAPSLRVSLEMTIYRTFFARRDEATYASSMTRLMAAAELPYHQALEEMTAVHRASEDMTLSNLYASMFTSGIPRIFESAAGRQAQVDLTRLGLLIELHHAEHGAWPEDLALLAPELGGQVPLDPFSGQPYRYQPTAEGFTLYSLGSNLEDNGGRHDRGGEGDIVWRGEA